MIVGGGLAGLSAATALANRDLDVTLIEARQKLGGRASSFEDPRTGESVDACQHVAMGCCTNLLHFCKQVGIDDLLRVDRTVWFRDETGRTRPLRPGWLPAPFHLTAAFLGMAHLTWTEKLRVGYALACLARQPKSLPGQSFGDWLRRRGQTERTIDRFWGLVITSALNESVDRSDYRYARQVFVEGFLWDRRANDLTLPTVLLSDLYGGRLAEWLTKAGVAVRTHCAVARLEWEGDRVVGCHLRTGERLDADQVLLAVPFQRVAELLPSAVTNANSFLHGLCNLTPSPITSVHLWYDRRVMEMPHLVPVGRRVQWLFKRPHDGTSTSAGDYVQAVISASDGLMDVDKDAVLASITREVAEILPATRSATLVASRLVRERWATFSVQPGVDRHRPPQAIGLPNLYLAGDYTRTGWPATMEGAVRSGYLAAEALLRRLGRTARLLQPGLPGGPLARLLIRPAPVDEPT